MSGGTDLGRGSEMSNEEVEPGFTVWCACDSLHETFGTFGVIISSLKCDNMLSLLSSRET